MTTPSTDTRARLLDAAERAFSDKGFDGAALREITTEAKANLAAVHYHFGSKEELFLAVVARRIEPLNRERLALLDAAEAKAGARAPALEDVIEALVAPMLRLARDEARGGAAFVRLFGRLQNEPEAIWRRILGGPLAEVRARFSAALARALPELDRGELAWRMHFAIGALCNVIVDRQRLELLSDGQQSSEDVEGAIAHLVPFLAAAFRARTRPSPAQTRSARR
ncbi:MAG: TetR family transcriptional regulator [Planctomycetes bacterium]|nr:TetR family transcriptional regulator [Planctomycetota bacterium]